MEIILKIIYKVFVVLCIKQALAPGALPQTQMGELAAHISPSWAAGGHPSRTFPPPPPPPPPPWGLSQFHTNPASGSVYPTIHTCILSWLHHCMVESTYNMLSPPPPPPQTHNLATGQRVMNHITT